MKSESSQEVVKMVTQTGPLWHTVLSYGRVDCVDEHNRDRAGGDSDTATFRHEGHDNQPKIPRRPTHGKKKQQYEIDHYETSLHIGIHASPFQKLNLFWIIHDHDSHRNVERSKKHELFAILIFFPKECTIFGAERCACLDSVYAFRKDQLPY